MIHVGQAVEGVLQLLGVHHPLQRLVALDQSVETLYDLRLLRAAYPQTHGGPEEKPGKPIQANQEEHFVLPEEGHAIVDAPEGKGGVDAHKDQHQPAVEAPVATFHSHTSVCNTRRRLLDSQQAQYSGETVQKGQDRHGHKRQDPRH